jgi:hypothetical protein
VPLQVPLRLVASGPLKSKRRIRSAWRRFENRQPEAASVASVLVSFKFQSYSKSVKI